MAARKSTATSSKRRTAKAPKRAAKAPAKRAKAKPAKPRRPRAVPEGFGTLTPHLVIEGAAEAMEFYKRAFGAEELARAPMPDGKRLMHGLMTIGDSMLMLVDALEELGMKGPKALGGTVVSLHLYVPDADAAFDRAVEAGCAAAMAPADMFWGDRYAKVKDPFGHEWSLATRIREMTPEEMAAAQKAAFATGKPGG